MTDRQAKIVGMKAAHEMWLIGECKRILRKKMRERMKAENLMRLYGGNRPAYDR